MKNWGTKVKILICLALCIFGAFFATVNFTYGPLKTSATTANAEEVSFDDFIDAFERMNTEYEPSKNTLVFLDKAYELTTDDDGEYLISEQVFRHVTGTPTRLTLSTQSTAQTRTCFVRRLTDLATETGYEITTGNQSVALTRPYGLKRIVIYATSDDLDLCGAVASVSYHHVHIHQYATEEDTRAAYEYYQTCPSVRSVFVDQYCWAENEDLTLQNTNTNQNEYLSWGAEKMGVPDYQQYLLDTVKANNNDINALPEVVVAVLDTGIDTDHPLFADRFLRDSRNRIIGKDFTHISGSGYAFEDDQGHGTHCAGIICDLTLPNVKILPIKFMSVDPTDNQKTTGTMSDAMLGIMYAIDKKSDYNIAAINMSFGVNVKDKSERDKQELLTGFSAYIDDAYDAGIFSVVAAGNDHINVSNFSPANVDKAITVSALTLYNQQLFFDNSYSNYGSGIDVCAPGTQIFSAYPNGTYTKLDGTSMAAPHVAAYIALLQSDQLHSHLQDEIYQILTDSNSAYLQDLGPLGKDTQYGNGLPILTTAVPNYVMVNVSAGELGSVSPAGYGLYTKGADLTLTFTPDENSYVSKIIVDGNEVADGRGRTQYHFTNLSQSHTVVVEFESNGYTVEYYLENLYDTNSTAPHQYTIERAKFTGEIGQLTTAVPQTYSGFTAQPYQQETITSDGKTVVKIYYTRNKYQVTTQKLADDKGIIRIDGGGEYLYGAEVVIKPTFRSGYGLSKWELTTCNDLSFNSQINPNIMVQKFAMPASDLTLMLYSEEGVYQITVKITGNGSASPEEVWVHAGEAMIFELKPEPGYTIKSVSYDGVDIEPNEVADGVYAVNLYNINDNTELAVTFTQKQNSQQKWLDYLIWGGGGVFAVILFTGSTILTIMTIRIKRQCNKQNDMRKS
ncbi:MAG: S8 family serine peptidase [Eubacteriales bacterium]|nr:S8 family serine peptidase [Eubacteriales bacterium]